LRPSRALRRRLPIVWRKPVGEERTAGAGGARITLPFGTDIEASLDASRTETNSAFSAVNPQYDANGRIASLTRAQSEWFSATSALSTTTSRS